MPLRGRIERLREVWNRPVRDDIDALRSLVGASAIRGRTFPSSAELREVELKVHSQFGEDGIIAHLLDHLADVPPVFVEIGVESYRESNTRFLMLSRGWSGLIIDGGEDHVHETHRRGYDIMYGLESLSVFVSPSNIDAVLREAGFAGDIGLLSIDIDGIDLWLFSAIRSVRPAVLVVEYNSLFGPELAVSVPPADDFVRREVHHSELYFGASIAAWTHIAEERGYQLVGSNSAGNNAFFVDSERANGLPRVSPADAWVSSRFRQSRDIHGKHSLVKQHADQLALISDLPLVEVSSQRQILVGELLVPERA